jgi:hypothetical protein
MIADPCRQFKVGDAAMTPAVDPEPRLPLTGLTEASLYHDPGQHGFFSLLWCDPRQEPRLERLRQEKRQLKLHLAAVQNPESVHYDASGKVAQALEATLNKLPNLKPKLQQSYRLKDLPRVIEALDPNRDTWISQAEFFRPNRRVVYLLRLNLCFVDLDTYKTPWQGYKPETMASVIRGFCQDEDIPEPSLILYSGRGLQVKWLFERPLPRAALPRWNAIQKQLVTALERFGADPGARDASRLLRLVDTINTRSGERVRVLWVNEREGEVSHYGFDYLAERILPVDRDTLRKQRDVREEHRQEFQLLQGGKTGHLRIFSGRQLAWDRLEDLRTLAKLRGWTRSGIPHGYRSKYIHWCLNFLLLSGAVHSSQLFHEAQALVREVCPDFNKDMRSVLSTLYRKAQAYEAGEKVEFEGRRYPPLYTPRNSTILDLFDITDKEIKQLKTIVTEEEAEERHRKRERVRRKNSGTMDRVTYLETAEQRRVEARLRRARGESLRQIAEALEVSIDAVKTYLYR